MTLSICLNQPSELGTTSATPCGMVLFIGNYKNIKTCGQHEH